ncbi:DUF1045 domain-containing protein [Tepidamorphus sp. 3E244]|uniref:DUF1045 domain-containing protein n=1 Tax=Tepidamorphus sp. 3E244 TaxID=3385498 RepID=UPI0038FD14BA
MRFAVYFAPDPRTALWRAGCNWLGRDAATGEAFQPEPASIMAETEAEALVAAPSRYGFHATLVAPFHLADGVDVGDIKSSMLAFAETHSAREVRLHVSRLSGFVALTPADEQGAQACSALAEAALRHFDSFRAPLSEADFDRRGSALDDERLALLRRWGYAHVLDHFRFHMTLSGRLADGLASSVEAHAARYFAETLAQPMPLDRIVLFIEDAPGKPMRIHTAVTIGGQ